MFTSERKMLTGYWGIGTPNERNIRGLDNQEDENCNE